MIRISLSGLLKFLTGILLVQAATGILVVVALRTENHDVWLLLALLALTLSLLTAFWFASIITHAKQSAVAQLREGFSREREKIRIRAEREKSKVMEKSHQQIIKDRGRFQTKSNLRSGALFAGVLGLGGILAFTQFFTFGLLLMTTAGGALGGYLLHARPEMFRRKQQAALQSTKVEKQIGEGVGSHR